MGQRDALRFGAWLRERYVDRLGLLGVQYEPGSVRGRTTNYARTVATLRGVLAGLYPGNNQPVPVTASAQMDGAWSCSSVCLCLPAAAFLR